MPLISTGPSRTFGLALALAGSSPWLLGACASAPMPTTQMAVAEAAVQGANTRSTSENAGAQLQLAIAKLDAARAAVDNRDYEGARRLAEQAQVDAQRAQTLAQSVRTRQAAQDSQDAARALSEELARKALR